MEPFLDNFDNFVDDLLSSDIDLLKTELDFLLLQHIFNSISLDDFKKIENISSDQIAA